MSNLPMGLASQPPGKSCVWTTDSSGGFAVAPRRVPITSIALFSPEHPRAFTVSSLSPLDKLEPPVLTHLKLTPAFLILTGFGGASREVSSPRVFPGAGLFSDCQLCGFHQASPCAISLNLWLIYFFSISFNENWSQ